MFDDIAALFRENVVDTFEKYLDTKRSGIAGVSRDMRAALVAATAMYHFREHLPATYTKSRAEVVRQCPDYSLLGDVVNASKHRELTHGNPELDSADQIQERLVITEYHDAEGDFRHIEKRVILRLTSGADRDLLDVLISVINFWQSELAALGVIASRPSYSLACETQPRTRADCNSGRVDFECIQGVRFKPSFCFRRFNYATGTIEPVDLTESEFEFQILKPIYNADLSFRNNSTGQVVSRTIALTQEEHQKVLECQSDQERQRYLTHLPQGQEAIRELVEEVRSLESSSNGAQTGSQPTE